MNSLLLSVPKCDIHDLNFNNNDQCFKNYTCDINEGRDIKYRITLDQENNTIIRLTTMAIRASSAWLSLS